MGLPDFWLTLTFPSEHNAIYEEPSPLSIAPKTCQCLAPTRYYLSTHNSQGTLLIYRPIAWIRTVSSYELKSKSSLLPLRVRALLYISGLKSPPPGGSWVTPAYTCCPRSGPAATARRAILPGCRLPRCAIAQRTNEPLEFWIFIVVIIILAAELWIGDDDYSNSALRGNEWHSFGDGNNLLPWWIAPRMKD